MSSQETLTDGSVLIVKGAVQPGRPDLYAELQSELTPEFWREAGIVPEKVQIFDLNRETLQLMLANREKISLLLLCAGQAPAAGQIFGPTNLDEFVCSAIAPENDRERVIPTVVAIGPKDSTDDVEKVAIRLKPVFADKHSIDGRAELRKRLAVMQAAEDFTLASVIRSAIIARLTHARSKAELQQELN